MSPLLLALLACTKGGDDSGLGDDLTFSDIGSFSTEDTGNITADIPFDVSDGSSSVMVYCGSYGSGRLGVLSALFEPNGDQLYENWLAPTATPYRAAQQEDQITFLIPYSPDADLSAGTWSMNLWVQGPTHANLDCKMVTRAGVGDRKLAIAFVFVGGTLDAASAPADANWQAVEAEFTREWESAGFELSFTYADFTGNADTYSVVDVTADDYGEFLDLLATASPSNPRAVTLFIVDEISTDEGVSILGKSGGPPGTAAVGGTSASGVVVMSQDLGDDPVLVGKIAAHETGHFVGLFHTTEMDGSSHDPLSDTPQCTSDTDGNGVMNSSECAGKGAENVMFWTANDNEVTFSDDQAWVMERNPAAR